MLKYLLDTNACINYLKFSNSPIRAKLQSLAVDEIAVCSVVKFELYYGSYRSSDPVRSLEKQNQFLVQFRSLNFGDPEAVEAGKIRASLASIGKMIGAYDIQIAAISLTNDLTLVTHNTSEFSRIENLKLEDWQI
ncbi:MAG: type II toxin-antitoxin system VapC family toxin [Pyrinomonadaceae bacterium]